jgi:GNAT superfamily N-acetyltransferase
MTMQAIIGPLRRDEVADLLPLCEAFCREDGHPFDADRVRRALVGLLDQPERGTTLVARHEGRPVGYAVVTLGWSLESGGLDALLDELYLVPEQRGAGLGASLVDAALELATRLGAARIFCEVEAGNDRARRLYERLGFEGEDSQMFLRWL